MRDRIITQKDLVIGLDYGTDSVRALLVDTESGSELATSVYEYPRWKKGLYCDSEKNQFRQHPLDYIEGLQTTIQSVIQKVSGSAERVTAISIDTTGSTPVAVNQQGLPLALMPEFSEDPDAMFILWKDHTSTEEADQINALCKMGLIDYSGYSGGIYSSEWFWSKILHVIKTNTKVACAAYSWVEHCDWMPALLTGLTDPLYLKRSRCAAGHKAMWHADWKGLPSSDFLTKLHPQLGYLKDRLFSETFTSDTLVGTLTLEWAEKLGLETSVMVGVGAFDAHFGAVGGQIEPFYLSKVIGTSTCDMIVVPIDEIRNKLIRGISGQVNGSIIPGMLGMEAGQSAFGDVYAWFRDLLMWPLINMLSEEYEELINELGSHLISKLSTEASRIPIASSGILALDWLNGRRTPDVNPYLKGTITGLTLGTDAPKIFRALVEATAFGAKKITERFTEEGVKINGVIALGGVAKKSSFVMQILSDVLNMPIKVVRSENACALGAAMFASVVAGIHVSIEEAQRKMGSGTESEYIPNLKNVMIYDELYKSYCILCDFNEYSEFEYRITSRNQ